MLILSLLLATLTFQAFAFSQTVVILQPGKSVNTLVGDGDDRQTASAGDALTASLGSPRGLAYDPHGNLYIADSRNHVVSRRDTGGGLTVVAGSGHQGYSGDGGPATQAELNSPSAIAIDSQGDLLIADTGNHCIRRVDTSGVIQTIAGTGKPGFSGDGGAATAALLRLPSALALDSSNNVYIADTGNHRIRKLLPAGTLTTIAGSGTEGADGDGGAALAASMEAPSGLTFLPDGRLLIADRSARRLRTLKPDGSIAAYPPNDALNLRRPEGVTADATGSIYTADAGAQIVLQSGSDGVSLLAGSGEQSVASEGSASATPLDSPAAVATIGTSGDIAISNRRDHQIQRVVLPHLDFGGVTAGQSSTAQAVLLQNGGMTALQVLAVQLPAGFGVAPVASATCGAAPFSLQPAAQCSLSIQFQPTAQGDQSGIAQIRIVGAAPQSLLLSGTGLPGASLAGSSLLLKSNGSVSYLGTPVAFTAIASGSLATAPTGNVVFFDGDSAFATVPLSGGAASLVTSALQQGQHELHAAYSGDALYSSSTSATVQQTVSPTPDFLISVPAGSYSAKAGGSISIPTALQPVNGTLGHPVTLTVTGMPDGASASILPATVNLAGDPVSVTITLQLPPKLAAERGFSPAVLLMAASLCGWICRRRRMAALTLLALIATLLSGGCAAGSNSSNASGTPVPPSAQHYVIAVTATTTGVTGDLLAHTASVGLDVTP